MAALTNNINKANVASRYGDYVAAAANANIVWGTNSKPFAEMPTATFGGDTNGKANTLQGRLTTTLIEATAFRNATVAETNQYSRIRLLRARLFVAGGGGNTGSRPSPGYIYDLTRKSHLNSGYEQNAGTPNTNFILPPVAGVVITIGTSATPDVGVEEWFDRLRAGYNTASNNTVTIQIDVCHASCHSSCHGSRGRR
jgi:hypothetical protein